MFIQFSKYSSQSKIVLGQWYKSTILPIASGFWLINYFGYKGYPFAFQTPFDDFHNIIELFDSWLGSRYWISQSAVYLIWQGMFFCVCGCFWSWQKSCQQETQIWRCHWWWAPVEYVRITRSRWCFFGSGLLLSTAFGWYLGFKFWSMVSSPLEWFFRVGFL